MGITNLGEVAELLHDGNLERLRAELESEESKKFITEDGMELLSTLIGIGLTGLETLNAPSTQMDSLSEVLCVVARVMSPKEVILSILEQFEIHGDKVNLKYVMKSLRISMDKEMQATKRISHLKWILNTVNTLTDSMELPLDMKSKNVDDDQTLEKLENTLLQSKVYNHFEQLTMFYNYFISAEEQSPQQVASKFDQLSIRTFQTQQQEKSDDTDGHEHKNAELQKVYIENLINLLGYPLFNIPNRYEQKKENLASNSNDGDVPALKKTRALEYAEYIMKLLEKLGANLKLFLDLLDTISTTEYYQVWLNSENKDAAVLTYKDFKIDMTSLGNYFYLIHIENMGQQQPHAVSSPVYVFHQSLFVINYLLSKGFTNTYQPYIKTLSLAQHLLEQLCPNTQYHRLKGEMVNSELHFKFLEFVIQAAGYSESKEIRRVGINVLRNYLWAFDASGRFYILQRIFHTVEHIGLYGYVITHLKNFVFQALSIGTQPRPFPNEALPLDMDTWFLGKNLQVLLESVLKLNNGSKTDLMHYFDQIISALNFLRFLLLRDGKENRSGLLNYMTNVNENFLKPLQSALDFSCLHYKGKIRELEDPNSTVPKDVDETDYNLFVGHIDGEKIKHPSEYTKEEHISTYQHCLNELDLMQGILARVMECYQKAAHPSN